MSLVIIMKTTINKTIIIAAIKILVHLNQLIHKQINRENKQRNKYSRVNHTKVIMIYLKMQIIQEIHTKQNFRWIEYLKD